MECVHNLDIMFSLSIRHMSRMFAFFVAVALTVTMILSIEVFAARGPAPVVDYKTGKRLFDKELNPEAGASPQGMCRNGNTATPSRIERCINQVQRFLVDENSRTKCVNFMVVENGKFKVDSDAKAQCKDKVDALKTPDDAASTPNECAGVKTYFEFGCSDSANTDRGGRNNPIIEIALIAISWITGLVSLVVVGGVVYGALLYMTARDNASQTQQGITVIVNAVIALLLLISFYVIINFLVPGGLFRAP